MSPARAVAYTVLRRVFEQGAYADRALTAEAAGLHPRDRSLAMALAYGAVQRRLTLDHVATTLTGRPLVRLEPAVVAGLRLGLHQLLFMDGIAEHAAVHETVELVKGDSRAGSGLVNAVLRRATREGAAILGELRDDTPAHAALRHSVPPWLAELWWHELGAERAGRLLDAVNRPAESAIRVNTLLATPGQVAAELGIASHPAPGIPEGIVLHAPFDAHGSPLWQRGAIMPQSRASMIVARTLDPQPGERVLDLCAAPGAKTTHIAALMRGEGRIVAVERHAGRAQALERTVERMGALAASVRVGDAAETMEPVEPGGYDRVLVDPPCSGLGTLGSRPDLRWRTSPERIAELAPLQARILRAGAAATRPGGTLVYSVCTICAAESADVVQAFLAAARSDWRAEAPIRLAPDTDGTDGFFIARLRREGAV